MGRIVGDTGELYWGRAFAVCVLCAGTAIALPAQTFATLHSFDGTDGTGGGALVQSTDGKFYGTAGGGSNSCPPYGGCGTIFSFTPGGTLTILHSFDSTDGASPAGLVQATNEDFYGTTVFGGSSGYGTVFRLSPAGVLRTLHNFDANDGSYPTGCLIQGTNRNLYGTAQQGGSNNVGTVFTITQQGTLTTLYSFDGTNGADPLAGLVQATNGNFYGTTLEGGTGGFNDGTVFEINSGGAVTTLHSFSTDGSTPYGSLVQATNGNFYGTTITGGAYSYGTVFRITRQGKLTTLYNFQQYSPQGGEPQVGLVQGTDGNLYGTTAAGGGSSSCYAGCGTIFSITPMGMLTTLHSFDSTDGIQPGALVQATDGDFYGTTVDGGANGDGTIFKLSVGLGPFVKTLPTSGRAGAPIQILGTDLTGATSVTFNGTPAAFTVNATGTAISTTVPTGATTGTVQVVAPTGTLSSNVPFRVP
jgi:uncharacterized repeat protein (TIGR03803 family)